MEKLLLRPGSLDNLKEARGVANDEAMAHAVGCSARTYGRVKRGDQSPSLDLIANLCAVFSIEPDQLLESVPDEVEKLTSQTL